MATSVVTGAEGAVRTFGELRRDDVDFAGGKGANLGELTAAGVPVPDGFVIGAPAYAAFCDSSGVREQLHDVLTGLDAEDTSALQAASARAKEVIMTAPLPDALAAAIAAAHAELVGKHADLPVAVRSSATAEDTASASFAGMNESFLNVRGKDAALAAIRRCWALLFGGRTIYYRATRGYEQAGMDIAVVVQRQIASTRSGVLFTVDPATGASDRIVLEASFALGEAVVSGSVSPDRFVVDKDSLSILKREIRRKELVIEPNPDGGTVSRELSDEEALKPTCSALRSALRPPASVDSGIDVSGNPG